MTSYAPLKRRASLYDGWRSISISLYMTLVGYGVLVAIPVISSARVRLLGFSEVEVGRLSSADLGGLTVGAIIASLGMAKTNRRVLVFIGAVLAILANAYCTRTTDYQAMLFLRMLAGIGSGIYTSVAVANLGATNNPARAYNLMLFAFAFSQAFELQVLPRLSMNGIYYAFIGSYLFGLLGLKWIPAGADAEQLDAEFDDGNILSEHRHVPASIIWLCLLAIFLTYVNIGAYWTYIELAALEANIDGELIGRLLVWGALCSVLGCLLATLISNRFGLVRPLLLAIFAMTLAVALPGLGMDTFRTGISVLSFNLLWIFIDVYQMAFVANADHSGTFAALIPSAQGLGQIVGPNLAASMIADASGYDGVFLMCAAFALLGLITYLVVYLRLQAILPALVDAS
ncbi:MAG: hypothetical protein PHH11_00300 [Methylomonas sp.]|nr:hypothetical protein [Methylomonas sp.]